MENYRGRCVRHRCSNCNRSNLSFNSFEGELLFNLFKLGENLRRKKSLYWVEIFNKLAIWWMGFTWLTKPGVFMRSVNKITQNMVIDGFFEDLQIFLQIYDLPWNRHSLEVYLKRVVFWNFVSAELSLTMPKEWIFISYENLYCTCEKLPKSQLEKICRNTIT